jgi:HEAT repeat protein
VNCVLCHSENRVDVIHCVRCGAHLERARAKREALQAAKRRSQKERDQLLREKEARQQQEKLERLLAALDDPENHEFVIFQLNQMGDDAVEALVETLLHDHDVDARYGSAMALGQICATQEVKALIKARATKGLIKALADSEPVVRYWSADALSQCGSQTAVEPLAALLKDSHVGVRQQARQALQKIGGKQAEEILDRHAKGFISWIKGN